MPNYQSQYIDWIGTEPNYHCKCGEIWSGPEPVIFDYLSELSWKVAWNIWQDSWIAKLDAHGECVSKE